MFTKKEVNSILRETGKKIKTENFDFFLAPKTAETARLLIITSRKIGNAPKRNKLRRRLKSIFYENKLFENKYDCIIVAKNNAVNVTFDDLKLMISNIFGNA